MAFPNSPDTFSRGWAQQPVLTSQGWDQILTALEQLEKITAGPVLFNPMSYGALGSGANDTTAFQNCMNAAQAARGTMIIPPNPGGGSWYVSTLTLPGSNFSIRGMGPFASRIDQVPGTVGPLLRSNPAVTGALTYIDIRDVLFSAFSNQTSNTGGILLEGVSHSSLDRIQVTYARDYGIKVLGYGAAATGDAMYNRLNRSIIQNLIAASSPVAVHLATGAAGSHPDQAIVSQCVVNMSAGTVFKIEGSGAHLPPDGCLFLGNASMGVPAVIDSAGKYVAWVGNRFEVTNSATMTVTLQAGGTYNSFQSNTFAVNDGATPGALTFTDNTNTAERLFDVQTDVTDGFVTLLRGRVDFLKYLQLTETTDPAAPAANQARLYTRDSAGKTQLVARFPSGAVQVIATEP